MSESFVLGRPLGRGMSLRNSDVATGQSEARMRLELAALRRQVQRLAERNGELTSQLLCAWEHEEKARTFAYHDELTGLPNRRMLQDRFRCALAQVRRQGHQLAVLIIDLNKFKSVNDAYGHLVGDMLLISVARRLQTNVRVTDTVCRYGGDEFVVLLSDVQTSVCVERIVQKLRAALQADHELCGRSIPGGASIGVSVYPNDGIGLEELIARADAEMYKCKRSNGDLRATQYRLPPL